jgi:hypothetical protein
MDEARRNLRAVYPQQHFHLLPSDAGGEDVMLAHNCLGISCCITEIKNWEICRDHPDRLTLHLVEFTIAIGAKEG